MVKFPVSVASLQTSVDALLKSVAKKSPHPSVSNIKFEVVGNKLSLTTTDFITMTTAEIDLGEAPFDVDEFCVLVDAEKFSKFVKSVNGDKLTIEYDDKEHRMVVRCKKRTTLTTAYANEFPLTDFAEPQHRLEINPEAFGDVIKLVSGYHLPYNDAQLTISRGIQLSVNHAGIRAIANNGSWKASIATFGDPDSAPIVTKLVIIGDQLGDHAKVLQDADELSIGIPDDISGNKKVFLYGVYGGVKIKTLIQALAGDTEYPDIYTVASRSAQQPMLSGLINVEELLDIFSLTSVYDEYATITMSEDKFEITVTEPSTNSSYDAEVDVIELIRNIGEDQAIFRIIAKVFTDALKNVKYLDSENVKIATSATATTVFVMPGHENADGITSLQALGKIAM